MADAPLGGGSFIATQLIAIFGHWSLIRACPFALGSRGTVQEKKRVVLGSISRICKLYDDEWADRETTACLFGGHVVAKPVGGWCYGQFSWPSTFLHLDFYILIFEQETF